MAFGSSSLQLMFVAVLLMTACGKQASMQTADPGSLNDSVDAQVLTGEPVSLEMQTKVEGLFAHAQVNRIMEFATENLSNDSEYQSLITKSPYLATVVQDVQSGCTVQIPETVTDSKGLRNETIKGTVSGGIQGSGCPVLENESANEVLTYSNVSEDQKSYDLNETDTWTSSLTIQDQTVVKDSGLSLTTSQQFVQTQVHVDDPAGIKQIRQQISGSGTLHLSAQDVPMEVYNDTYVATERGQTTALDRMLRLKVMIDGQPLQVEVHRQITGAGDTTRYFINGGASTEAAVETLLSGTFSTTP